MDSRKEGMEGEIMVGQRVDSRNEGIEGENMVG